MGDNDAADFTLESPLNPVAATRSRVYALLAEGLSFPEGSVALRLLDGDWRGDLEVACAQLSHAPPVPGIDAMVDGTDSVHSLKRRYSALFDVNSGVPSIPLLERRFVEMPEQQLWERLLRFYTHFGLDFSQGVAAEQTDHLLTELSFVHYLAYLEAGTSTGAAALLRGQRDFLAHHLEGLTAGAASSAAALEEAGLYGEVIAFAAAFVSADAQYCRELAGTATGGR